jgi:hypothetical protein
MTFQQFRAKMQEERRLKRTRVKSSIPAHKRCSALRKDGEQCYRRRTDESIFCGTHIKGTPHAKKSVIHSAFEDNSDPAKGISLVISRVFRNIGWQRIKQIFMGLGWGYVERVDAISVQGGEFKRAYVHFAPGKWNTRNPEAMAALDALRNGQLVKIIYDEPWFWNVSISRSKKPLEGHRAQVMHGTAYKTSGGLTRVHLMFNKHGRIVSKKKLCRRKCLEKLLEASKPKPKPLSNRKIKRYTDWQSMPYKEKLLEASKPKVIIESIPTSGESKKNNTKKNTNNITEKNRRRKERANAAQKRLNKTRKQNAGRRKKRKTWKQKTKRKTRRKNK